MNHRVCYKRSTAARSLGSERATASESDPAISILTWNGTESSAADYGPRLAPTLSDRQASAIARHDAERRELMRMMCENLSLGGGY